MSWNPASEDIKYLNLILVMTTDCLMGKGTVDRETYLDNLKHCITILEKNNTKITMVE